MTISTTSPRADYTGDGSTTVFAYAFKITKSSDLVVTKADQSTPPVETTLVLGSDYSVSGVGVSTGGNVTLTVALTSGYHLTIKRVRPNTQATDIRNQGEFLPEIHENEFDDLVMQVQDLQEQLDRAVLLRITNTLTGLEIDTPAANSFLYWDSSAKLIRSTTAQPASITLYSPPTNGFSQDTTVQSALDKLNPRVHGTRAAPILQTAAAVAADQSVYDQVWYLKGSPGAVDLTALPGAQIAAGNLVGQIIEFNGCDDTNPVKIGGTGGASLVATNGVRTLENGTCLRMRWDGTIWSEIYFNNL